MKTALLTILLVISLVLAENASAVTHEKTGPGNNLQPKSASDVIVEMDEFADMQTIEALLLKLDDPDPFVRVEAVQSLGEIQQEKALVLVCSCLNDENMYVRAYAAEALGKIGKVDVSLTLLRLLTALDDPSPYARAMMVAALGELQEKSAVESIRNLLHDEDESVRGMAEWALKNIENAQ
ncbi:HEAT repeat domain-containing protein [Thermodesulfobacteriota bacterium]